MVKSALAFPMAGPHILINSLKKPKNVTGVENDPAEIVQSDLERESLFQKKIPGMLVFKVVAATSRKQ